MRVSRWLLVLTVAIVVTGTGWMYAQQRGAQGTLSAQDYFEIDQLVQGYTRGVDMGPEDPSWVFTPDAVFVHDGREVRGEKALKEFYANVRKNHDATRPKERHVLSNLVVKAVPGGATGSVYVTTIEGQAAPDAIPIKWYGMYEDTFVKTAAGWRIRKRVDTHVQ